MSSVSYLNPDYKPDWESLYDFHASRRDRLQQEASNKAKGKFNHHNHRMINDQIRQDNDICLKILDTYQHQTVLDYAKWLFRNFPPIVNPKHVQDFRGFQTMKAVKQHRQDLLNIEQNQSDAESKKWSDAFMKDPELYSKLY